jgi:hypothetical protein
MIAQLPKVTVFIPAYNREKYIGDAIESVLSQTYTDFEILLIDDGSTDRTVEIMRSYTDPRLRIIRNEKNLGIPETRNKGLENARGRAYPIRLEKQVAFLDRNPDFAQVGSWCRMMDEQGRPLKKTKRQPILPDDIDVQLLFRCSLSNRSIMGRTELLREFGYRNDFPRCQDYDLHVKLAKKYKLGNLPECLVYGRIHPEQITGQTFDLGDAKKREIVRGQLTELGVQYNETDLDPHLTLSRMRKLQFIPDLQYIQWAENWLQKILKANQKTRRYSQKALESAVGEKWMRTCWTAWTGIGLKAYQHFFRSPLRRTAAISLKQNLFSQSS